jgi:hypothetical protein
LPMLGACFAAMLIPTLLSDPPLYDSLRENILRRAHALPGKTESADPDSADNSTVRQTGFDENESDRP